MLGSAPQPERAAIHPSSSQLVQDLEKSKAKQRATMALNSAVPPEDRSEVLRVVGMPTIEDLTQESTPDELEEVSKKYLLAGAYKEGFRLFPTQANALRRFSMVFPEDCGGFYPIGVGWGKTGLSLMMANQAFCSKENPKSVILLLIPPSLSDQLVNTDIPFWRKRTPIQYPVKVLSGRSEKERMMAAKLRSPGLYVMSYSQLSSKEGEELLMLLDADMVICDEAHSVADKGNSARSRRFYRFIQRRKPTVAGMSGTLTQKSGMEYFKLASICLRQFNFLPNAHVMAQEWCQLMSSESTKDGDYPYSGNAIRPIMPLVRWAEDKHGMEVERSAVGLRSAYQARMVTSPGVYSSGDEKIDVELRMQQVRVDPNSLTGYPGWEQLMELKKKVEFDCLTPNGDEIEHAIHKFKWLSEIMGAGFYNQLTWPEPEKYSSKKGISLGESQELIEAAKEHHSLGQHYHRLLRDYLNKRSRKGMDTPMLVGREFYNHGTDNIPREVELYMAWKEWKEAYDDSLPERERTAIFVCDFKLVELLKLLAQLPDGEGAIVWVENISVGAWAYDYVKESGFDALHCPSGPAYNSVIQDKKNADKVVIASIQGHGTGKNLQHFGTQIFLQWPRPANRAEQTIGRIHRNGQKRNFIDTYTIFCDMWDDVNFAATLNDALYIHQSMGTRQKLISASYDPLPVIFPSHVLREMGADNIQLTDAQQEYLIDKYTI